MFKWYTKYREEKRDYKQYKKRIDALPEDYKTAMKAIETYLWNFAKGAGMFEILKNVLEMFENAAADQLELKAVVGDDLAEFADSLLNEYPEETWMDKQRSKLRNSIK
ncbi:DUF1048 domain-containing protein [Listeria innocua]|uniref:Lin0728 protein n=1 Tax=Listeria innocua serovar 6a (strain ATCC BAA-680 / CLIP 11262) TaxID=272626 RepID=Q92DT4_LISIN|nr:DUF1048 domain-containing protein [Listeria innocua]EAA0091764.1 DUF1048 domain-containing protein [Listeria innocua]EAC4268092.1 DUF1048 domain-containing protein [Listeria innocua]ECC1680738.1 DUF1048 domain-containing protein [Listeria innocua]EEI9898555.1 DUF1048 domain-containing protein [Listeria innocua]EEJ1211991.1 DUF1048 domain-containing protein [Listeria innocua]